MGEWKELCLNEQRGHRISAAYYHDGNCRAERAWRTLLSKTRAMLHNARLGQRHWFQALRYAAWIHNRTVRRYPDGSTDTPVHRAYGVVADLSMARAWGCLALAYRPEAPQPRRMIIGRRTQMGITWKRIKN